MIPGMISDHKHQWVYISNADMGMPKVPNPGEILQAPASLRLVRFCSVCDLYQTLLPMPGEKRTIPAGEYQNYQGLLEQEAHLQRVVREALTIDGAHHKQWYLQQIARQLGVEVEGSDPGIAP